MSHKGDKHLTLEQRAQILESYQRTASTTLAARETGFPVHRVAAAIRRAGLSLTMNKGGACSRNIDLVRQLAAEGLSLSEIGRRVGTDHHKVAAFLRRNAIPYEPFQQKGPNNPAWRGGRMIDKAGYILIHLPEHPGANRHGYVREHRLVMERELGRPLRRGEVVDHIDGNTSNNAPENLRVFASNAEHLSATRRGRTPQWSEEGKARLREAARRGRGTVRNPTRPVSEPDDDRLPRTNALTLA